MGTRKSTTEPESKNLPSTIIGIVTVPQSSLLLKGKLRPIGFKTPGGYVKTAKGWRKVSGGTKEVKPERREKEELQSGGQPSEVLTDYRSIAKLSTAELKTYVKEKFNVSLFAGITRQNRDGGNLIVLQLGILHQLGFVNRKRVQIKIVDGIMSLEQGQTILAQYQPRHHRILVGKKYTDSFVHEYFHHLFYTKGLSKTKAVQTLLAAARRTETYNRYGKLDLRQGRRYYQDDTEVLSRLAESSVRTLLTPDLRVHVSPREGNNTLFSPAEVEKLKPLFVRAFRKGPAVLKSLCFLLDERLQKGAAGERAGHKYIRKEGNRYIYDEPSGTKKKIAGLELGKDGFYYHNGVKITSDPLKAEKYIQSKQERGGEKKPETSKKIEVGTKVRIKATALSGGKFREHKPRGMIAKIKEIGKDFVRIVDQAGQVFRVAPAELEFAKSVVLVKLESLMWEEGMKKKVVLFKAKARPVGFKTAGGYVKTAKGWRKAPSGATGGQQSKSITAKKRAQFAASGAGQEAGTVPEGLQMTADQLASFIKDLQTKKVDELTKMAGKNPYKAQQLHRQRDLLIADIVRRIKTRPESEQPVTELKEVSEPLSVEFKSKKTALEAAKKWREQGKKVKIFQRSGIATVPGKGVTPYISYTVKEVNE